jgi:hypothetical protein
LKRSPTRFTKTVVTSTAPTMLVFSALVFGACVISQASAQTFKRLGTCPTLGCVFPPDQTNFLAGQYFDIRLEVHAPVNGSEATADGKPDENFTFCIQRGGGNCVDAAKYFDVDEPKLETWTFKCVSLLNLHRLLTLKYIKIFRRLVCQRRWPVNCCQCCFEGVSCSRSPVD